jgi:hypothetical protein
MPGPLDAFADIRTGCAAHSREASEETGSARVCADTDEHAPLHEALVRIVTEIAPCTVRQAFYQATVRGVVEKTEAGYDRVQRALVVLRSNGRIA